MGYNGDLHEKPKPPRRRPRQTKPPPTSQCSKSHRACIVFEQLGPNCRHCIAVNQRCGFAMAADERAIRAEGVPTPEPCLQCIEKGTPQECFQPNTTQFAKLGTAYSGCQVHGNCQQCSINLAPRMQRNVINPARGRLQALAPPARGAKWRATNRVIPSPRTPRRRIRSSESTKGSGYGR